MLNAPRDAAVQADSPVHAHVVWEPWVPVQTASELIDHAEKGIFRGLTMRTIECIEREPGPDKRITYMFRATIAPPGNNPSALGHSDDTVLYFRVELRSGWGRLCTIGFIGATAPRYH